MTDRLLNAVVGLGVTLTDAFKYPKLSEEELAKRALDNTEKEFIKRNPRYAEILVRKGSNSPS